MCRYNINVTVSEHESYSEYAAGRKYRGMNERDFVLALRRDHTERKLAAKNCYAAWSNVPRRSRMSQNAMDYLADGGDQDLEAESIGDGGPVCGSLRAAIAHEQELAFHPYDGENAEEILMGELSEDVLAGLDELDYRYDEAADLQRLVKGGVQLPPEVIAFRDGGFETRRVQTDCRRRLIERQMKEFEEEVREVMGRVLIDEVDDRVFAAYLAATWASETADRPRCPGELYAWMQENGLGHVVDAVRDNLIKSTARLQMSRATRFVWSYEKTGENTQRVVA